MRKDEVANAISTDLKEALYYAASDYPGCREAFKAAIERSAALSAIKKYASSDTIVDICYSVFAELLILKVVITNDASRYNCTEVWINDFQKSLDTLDSTVNLISTTRFFEGAWVTRSYIQLNRTYDGDAPQEFIASYSRAILPPDYIVQYIYAKLFEIKANSLAVNS